MGEQCRGSTRPLTFILNMGARKTPCERGRMTKCRCAVGLHQRGSCPMLGVASVCTTPSVCHGLYNDAGHTLASAAMARA